MNKKRLVAGAFILACTFFYSFGISASAEPLLQDGKKTVFQRVVSHPGATLYSDETLRDENLKPRTFTSFYVFARKADRLQVGVSSSVPDGWIAAKEVTEWPQAITMVFTDQVGRDPVLFFRNHEEILKACQAENIGSYLQQYIKLFSQKAVIPENSPVIASEPMGKDGQISEDRFYLLPVLNIDRQFSESGTNLLQVASIDPGDSVRTSVTVFGDKAEDKSQPQQTQRMKTGIAFVIDTTISMRPYIDKTLALVKEIYDKLQTSPSKDDVEIAVVAFRNNVSKAPGIEYTTKVISDFKNIKEREELERLLGSVREASVPTHAFDEDSYAGVKEAVDKLDWQRLSSRAILLMTDAGPLKEGDPASSTGLSAEGLADYLRANNIFLTAVHIKTQKGKKDHKYAEEQYRTLSMMSNNRASYVDINAPTPEQGSETFRRTGKVLGDTYLKVVEATNSGIELERPNLIEINDQLSPEEKMRRLAEITGYAMQLQFAGRKNKTEAPEVVKAWMSDSDLTNLDLHPDLSPVPAVYPAVLLTKTQLSQLRKQLKLIIETAEEAFLRDSESFNFYEQLISAAAQMSRDPSKFNNDPNANLAQKGILIDVIDGLPYKSRMIGLKRDDWINMSTGDQQEFINRLKGLVKRYEEYDKDSRNWESFGSKNPNEWVYRVPLKMLP